MDKYYYFVSQLPLLIFGEKAYVGSENFLVEAQKWLSDKDLSAVLKVSINDFYTKGDDNKTLKKYKDFERSLREEIASFRSKGNQEIGFSNLNLREGTPLETEQRLLLLRWKFIEGLEEGHFFDLDILILYFLKLQVLERLLSFNKEKGIVRFDKLCEVA